MGIFPEFDEFEKNYAAGIPQVVWTEHVADLETPVSAFMKLADNEPYSFLFESVEGGATLGRYSFIGMSPDLIWQCKKGEVTVNRDALSDKNNFSSVDEAPLDSLRQLMAESQIDLPEGLPPSSVGIFGYMGYDMIRTVEDIPDTNPDTLNIPDSVMIRPTAMLVFDNIKRIITIILPVWAGGNLSADQAYANATIKIEDILSNLKTAIPSQTDHPEKTPTEVAANTSEQEYCAMVEKTRDYIYAGDIFQTVLSQRFELDFPAPPFSMYRSLRRLNPSPFLFYLNFDGFCLVGSSPEILVRVRDNTVTIRPLAGTRKRGETPAEDEAQAAELLADPKERAEHLMLLDLGRNDVGRVAKIGSVNVTDQFTVEKYSHVMHIVSNVEGELRDDLDGLDALLAGFPAGTVSGAPKIRAMEIIEELEKNRRSFYAGCVGYLGADGTVDSCITLRTALIKDGKVYIQAGAGIVADSDPMSEQKECRNKAQALIAAVHEALKLGN